MIFFLKFVFFSSLFNTKDLEFKGEATFHSLPWLPASQIQIDIH